MSLFRYAMTTSCQNGPLISPELRLTAYFEGAKHRGSGAISGLDAEDADFIDGVLRKAALDRTVRVDHSQLRDSHEAWVHVIISGDESDDSDSAIFSGFSPYPRLGILTWCNSD